MAGERKHVTVLFADVKASMGLAEGTDPEVFHKIMEHTARLLADGVHRFEGTVTQYTGDGVMALFGAPIAHEDHAHRACWAALDLRERFRRWADELRLADGLDLSLRIGLNSGEVVVGAIGDDLRMDYTAQGHTVGLAARMEQIAAADRVYPSERTARLVDGYFRVRDLLRPRGASSLGPTTVKGARARPRLRAGGRRGASDPARRLAPARLLALLRPRERDGGARRGARPRRRGPGAGRRPRRRAGGRGRADTGTGSAARGRGKPRALQARRPDGRPQRMFHLS
jgi:class 3 adenylate cyclase